MLSGMETRICARCCEDKLLSEFYEKSGRPGQFETRCKRCRYTDQRVQRSTPEYKAQFAAYVRARRQRDPERTNQLHREYRVRQPGADRAAEANHRARENGASGRLSVEVFNAIWVAQGGLCFYCSAPLAEGVETDHKTPLGRRGGTNEPENICLACRSCNRKKGVRTEYEFRNGLPRGDRPLTKTCTACGKTKAATEEFFYQGSRRPGLLQPCRPCRKKKNVAEQRRRRAAADW